VLSDFRGYHHNPCSNVRGVAHRLHRRSTRPWTSTTTTISLKKCLMKRTFAQTCSKRRRRTQFTLRRPWHRRCIRNDSRSSKGLLCSCDLALCQPRRHRRRDQSQAAVGSAHLCLPHHRHRRPTRRSKRRQLSMKIMSARSRGILNAFEWSVERCVGRCAKTRNRQTRSRLWARRPSQAAIPVAIRSGTAMVRLPSCGDGTAARDWVHTTAKKIELSTERYHL